MGVLMFSGLCWTLKLPAAYLVVSETPFFVLYDYLHLVQVLLLHCCYYMLYM